MGFKDIKDTEKGCNLWCIKANIRKVGLHVFIVVQIAWCSATAIQMGFATYNLGSMDSNKEIQPQFWNKYAYWYVFLWQIWCWKLEAIFTKAN